MREFLRPLRRRGRLLGMLYSGTLVFALAVVFAYLFLVFPSVLLHYGCSGPSSEVDGTFALWVGRQPVLAGNPSTSLVTFEAHSFRRCQGQLCMLRSHVSLLGLKGGHLPWEIEGIFKITSAVHYLLTFSMTFSFSVDPGLLASNGWPAVKDVFGSSRVVIPWAIVRLLKKNG